MAQMLLVNPRRRRKSRRGKARRINPRRKRRSTARRANPIRRRRRGRAKRRRNPLFSFAPRRKRSKRRSRSRRRNPISTKSLKAKLRPKNIQATLMNALPGAFGALGLDIALGYVPIPSSWKLGYLGYITKALGAIGIGMVAQNFVKPATAAKMTEGALTVMFHGILRNLTTQFAPSVPLGMYLDNRGVAGLGYYGSGWNPDYEPMSAYLPDMSRDNLSTDNRDLGMYMETDEYGF